MRNLGEARCHIGTCNHQNGIHSRCLTKKPFDRYAHIFVGGIFPSSRPRHNLKLKLFYSCLSEEPLAYSKCADHNPLFVVPHCRHAVQLSLSRIELSPNLSLLLSRAFISSSPESP